MKRRSLSRLPAALLMLLGLACGAWPVAAETLVIAATVTPLICGLFPAS